MQGLLKIRTNYTLRGYSRAQWMLCLKASMNEKSSGVWLYSFRRNPSLRGEL